MYSKIYYIFITIYILLVTIGNLLSINTFGYKFFTLNSSSMEPRIPSGSMVVIHQSKNEYQIGDIIAFYAVVDKLEMIVAHRVVNYGGNVYITKGDNNKNIDSQNVIPHLVIGKIIFHLPYLGYVLSIFSHPLGLFIFVTTPGILIVIIELIKVIKIIDKF